MLLLFLFLLTVIVGDVVVVAVIYIRFKNKTFYTFEVATIF